jgi:hypothetical protein
VGGRLGLVFGGCKEGRTLICGFARMAIDSLGCRRFTSRGIMWVVFSFSGLGGQGRGCWWEAADGL